MKTIVLDDDPTGTQSAVGVRVLLDWTSRDIADALRDADSVYLQTNSRALPEEQAVELVDRIAREAREALGATLARFVLRGDSTLRGHVFAETDRFLHNDAVMLFVPAFPAGGRTTRGGVHYVSGVPAADTEYARDPVFPFANSELAEYVREKSSRTPVPISLDIVRGPIERLVEAIVLAEAGSVLLPDAVTDKDVRVIAAAVIAAEEAGKSIVVRSAAPLAAELAGVRSDGLLPAPVVEGRPSVLVVCGSHTLGATAQLSAMAAEWGQPFILPTIDAMADPVAAGQALAQQVLPALTGGQRVVAIASERDRRASDNSLSHGERVMGALVAATRTIADAVDVVVAKGGITSAQIARDALAARSADVRGQILPGVSLWRLQTPGRDLPYVVVPGNVGPDTALVDVLHALGHGGQGCGSSQ